MEPIGLLPQVAREVLGAVAMMGADQPGFDVAEQGVDDREEFAGIGARALDYRAVLQNTRRDRGHRRDSRQVRRSADANWRRHWL